MRDQTALANPATLGLSAFAISQLLLNIPNAHLVPEDAASLFLPTILVTGGLVQLLCCVFEYARGNDFGTTTFGVYGSFFLSLGLLLVFQTLGLLRFGSSTGAAVGTFLAVWTLFTAGMTVIALRQDWLLGLTFIFICVAFLGGTLNFLVGLDSAYGGWGGIISALLGGCLVFRRLWEATGTTALAPAAQAPTSPGSAVVP